jgi:RHS repeat-associated protein
VDNVFGYCGYVFNSESYLYTVRFRNYDAATGRWTERDPAGYVNGMSLYEYASGRAPSAIDASGLFWHDIPGWRNGRRVTYHHHYKQRWNIFGRTEDYVETRYTYDGDELDNRGQSPYQREVGSTLNDVSGTAADAVEATAKYTAVVAVILLPGPDDFILVLASGTRLARIAGQWFEVADDGTRVAIKVRKAQDAIAESLGYRRVKDAPFDSHGQSVYKKGRQFITPDVDGHRGGFWKVYRGGERIGTYNQDLSRCVGH